MDSMAYYVVTEITERGGGYNRNVLVHGSNPFTHSIDFTINREDYDKQKLAIGDIVKIHIHYD